MFYTEFPRRKTGLEMKFDIEKNKATVPINPASRSILSPIKKQKHDDFNEIQRPWFI